MVWCSVLHRTVLCNVIIRSIHSLYHSIFQRFFFPFYTYNSFLADLIKELAGFGCKVETFLQVTIFVHAYGLTCISTAEGFFDTPFLYLSTFYSLCSPEHIHVSSSFILNFYFHSNSSRYFLFRKIVNTLIHTNIVLIYLKYDTLP